jgi:6-phosphofructokinase 1
VIGIPKTIDNDVWGTDITFGFDSAIQIATEAIDRLHTTANSHQRVMIIEVMGHHSGWIALYAGMAGGGDIILCPDWITVIRVGIVSGSKHVLKVKKLIRSVVVAEESESAYRASHRLDCTSLRPSITYTGIETVEYGYWGCSERRLSQSDGRSLLPVTVPLPHCVSPWAILGTLVAMNIILTLVNITAQ